MDMDLMISKLPRLIYISSELNYIIAVLKHSINPNNSI
jgi:hypothetical protein